MTDIAEQALRFSELIDMSSDGLVAMSLDGNIVAWNTTAQQLFGYRRDDVVGRHFDTLAPGASGDEARKAVARAVKDGSSKARVAWPRPDGTFIELDVSIRHVADNGAPGFIALRGNEVPSSVPGQGILEPSESLDPQIGGLLEAAPDAMVLVDAKGE